MHNTTPSGEGPGLGSVQESVASSWSSKGADICPDQISIPKLSVKRKTTGFSTVVGYPRTYIEVDKDETAVVTLGSIPSYGVRVGYEVYMNGSLVGEHDEIHGGYQKLGKRDYIVVDAGTESLEAYCIVLSSHKTKLRKGGSEILVRFQREIPNSCRLAFRLPLSFDLRVLDKGRTAHANDKTK